MIEKAVVIYVSGAPGAGKTTLAKILSEQLYIPHISSDLVHGGVALTAPKHNRRETLHDVFVPLMIEHLKRQVSFVVDHVLQKGFSEKDVIDKLLPCAQIVYIHVKAKDPITRYKDRVSSSVLPSVVERREHLLELAIPHAANLPNTNEPLDLGVPMIEVKTDDGYEPALQEIVAFIKRSIH